MMRPGEAQAVRPAAEAMEEVALLLTGRDLGTIHRDEVAAAAVAAAYPVIAAYVREQVAQEIESTMNDPKRDMLGLRGGLNIAARIARGVW